MSSAVHDLPVRQTIVQSELCSCYIEDAKDLKEGAAWKRRCVFKTPTSKCNEHQMLNIFKVSSVIKAPRY